MLTTMEYRNEQRACGHPRFVGNFMKENKDSIIIVDEIQ